ncbi:cysteine-rich repeat secretory protein 60-like, partial [Trifolium medium]|nr:cysteine-rich repeat secretory protein 60-like [Trifolium medium]
MPDCSSCVAHAVSRAGNICPGVCGGVVQLEGCYVKYDNDKFLGVEDKTIVLKKCGPYVG